MDVMLRKLRTIWRWTTDMAAPNGGIAPSEPLALSRNTPAPEPESAVEASPAAAPSPDATTPAPSAPPLKRPSTRVQRITVDVAALRGDMRTLESKIDAVQSRSDRLLQTIQSSGPRESADLSDLRTDLQALRAQLDDQHQQHEILTETMRKAASRSRDFDAANNSIASRLEQLALRVGEAQQQQNDLAAQTENLQTTLQNTIESINAMRAELVANESLRTREVAGRMVGLYVVGCVALTVAIATLVIVLTRVGL